MIGQAQAGHKILMVYGPDHQKASKLDSKVQSFKKIFKGKNGRKKLEDQNDIERQNRERSLEEKRRQQDQEGEISRQLKRLKATRGQGPPAQNYTRASAKGKERATSPISPGSPVQTYLSSPEGNLIYNSSSAGPSQPYAPMSSGATPARPAPSPPRIHATAVLEETRSEPSIPQHRTDVAEEPPMRHSESAPSRSQPVRTDFSQPRRQTTIERISAASVTEQVEALLRSNNPYLNGTYRTFLKNKAGAGSEFIAELEGSLPHYEVA